MIVRHELPKRQRRRKRTLHLVKFHTVRTLLISVRDPEIGVEDPWTASSGPLHPVSAVAGQVEDISGMYLEFMDNSLVIHSVPLFIIF